jgi:phosphoribosylanthranilate isomerase
MILKICGITNQEDASAAVEAGANAVGFNFYPRSPRYISPRKAQFIFTRAGVGRAPAGVLTRGPWHIAPKEAAAILSPAGVLRVGVFVNEKREQVEEIAALAHLDVAQLHGDEAPAHYPQTLPVWKALRVGRGFDISLFEDCPAEVLVLDGNAGAEYGGQGQVFDWSLIRQTRRKIVLAGGLQASNVALAIAQVKPWGVDACSLLESAPGKKDHKKMKEFLHAAILATL